MLLPKVRSQIGADGCCVNRHLRDKMTLNLISILLVEDNRTTLRASEKLLRADGYVVHTAEGYQAALDVAKKEKVDFAICDINLSDGDGSDLLHELKKLQPMQGIAVTGYTLPEETEHYREAGFGIVLRKPVDHAQIASAISQLSCTDRSTNRTTDLPVGEAMAWSI